MKLCDRVKTLRKEGRKVGEQEERVYIVDLVAWSTRARGRTGLGQLSWQNLAEFSGLSGIWQITVDCRRLRQSCGRFLVAKSVEIGGRV